MAPYYHGYTTQSNGTIMGGRIPYILNSRSMTFIVKGKSYTITADNASFADAALMVHQGNSGIVIDTDVLVGLTSPKALILSIGGDRLKVEDGVLFLDGEKLPQAWYNALLKNQNLARVLLINVGDTVRVAGDEDAPDGEYVVQGIDNDDPERRIYLETEDGYLGFIHSASIKESHDEKS